MENVRARLKRLGLESKHLENDGRLQLSDWYSMTLGKTSAERFSRNSLRISDLSIQYAKQQAPGKPPNLSEFLSITDNASVLARFNDEKAWVEFALTRGNPLSHTRKFTSIDGVLRGGHSEWAYNQLEAACDGVIDFRLEEEGETIRDLIRIRSMHDLFYDKNWHELKIGENFEVQIPLWQVFDEPKGVKLPPPGASIQPIGDPSLRLLDAQEPMMRPTPNATRVRSPMSRLRGVFLLLANLYHLPVGSGLQSSEVSREEV